MQRRLATFASRIQNDANVLETLFPNDTNFQTVDTIASQEWLSDLKQEQDMAELADRMARLLYPGIEAEAKETETEETEQDVETKGHDSDDDENVLEDYDMKYDVLNIENLDLFAHSDARGANYNGLSCIYPGLYLSGRDIATNVALLAKMGITAILRIMLKPPGPKLLERYKGAGIQHFLFLKQDVSLHDPISKHFDASYSFINEHMMLQRGRVLVHCRLGKERSATIVLNFLTKYLYLHDKLVWAYCRLTSILDLVELCVVLRRRCIKPPSFFRKELRRYEELYRNMFDIYDG